MAIRSVQQVHMARSVLLVYVLLSRCTLPARAQSPEEAPSPSGCGGAQTCPASGMDMQPARTFFDDASNTGAAYSQENVAVVTDNPGGFFWQDSGRFALQDKSSQGEITYQFDEGGMQRVRLNVAILFGTEDARDKVLLAIQPSVADCLPEPPSVTQLNGLQFSMMPNGMEHLEIEYNVGLLPAPNCKSAESIKIQFGAPEGSDIQIMSVKLIGDGAINGLPEIPSPDSNPSPDSIFPAAEGPLPEGPEAVGPTADARAADGSTTDGPTVEGPAPDSFAPGGASVGGPSLAAITVGSALLLLNL